MKELKELTVERLEDFIDDSENFGSLSISSRDLKALAKIALAAKQAEIVAYVTYKGHLLHAADPKVAEHSDPAPLYDAPPLNHTEQHMVVPDGWKLVPIEPTEDMLKAGCRFASEHNAKGSWSQMLAAAPKPESE